jgi:sialic acid synthase SpsE
MKLTDFIKSTNPRDTSFIKPYIIAEAGVNHEGDMDLAKRLIDEAKEGGADAIKFQTYKADTIASKNSPAYWDQTKESTDSQHKLFQKYDKFWKNEYEILKKYCDSVGIEFMSTPFDTASAKFLNDLMNVFKVSSSDLTNKPFIEYICEFGKPIILSTGASYLYEIQRAAEWVEIKGNPLVLLHCILSYPTADDDANLGMIADLKRKFPDKIVGYSDHTEPKDMKCLEMATLLGARVIEKHFTHDKTLPGNDHYHAMDKEDLKIYHEKIAMVSMFMGGKHKKCIENERDARQHARRSLVAKRDLQLGHVLTADDLTWKRPGHGVSPSYYDEVIGKKLIEPFDEDALLTWSKID